MWDEGVVQVGVLLDICSLCWISQGSSKIFERLEAAGDGDFGELSEWQLVRVVLEQSQRVSICRQDE